VAIQDKADVGYAIQAYSSCRRNSKELVAVGEGSSSCRDCNAWAAEADSP